MTCTFMAIANEEGNGGTACYQSVICVELST